MRARVVLLALLVVAATSANLGLASPAAAQVTPGLGTLASGTVTTAGTVTAVETNGVGPDFSNEEPGTTTIILKSSRTVINFQSFNLPAGQKLNFVFNSKNDVVLIRDQTGGATVAGELNAFVGAVSTSPERGGNVWMSAPNGAVFGQTADVNVGGLLATTADTTSADFLDDNLDSSFSGAPATSAVTLNGGSIEGHDGVVAFIAPTVSQSAGSFVGNAPGVSETEVVYGSAAAYNLTFAPHPSGGFDLLSLGSLGASRGLVDLAGTTTAGDVFIASVAASSVGALINADGLNAVGPAASGSGGVVLSAGGGLIRSDAAAPMQPVRQAGASAQDVQLGGAQAARGLRASATGAIGIQGPVSTSGDAVLVAAGDLALASSGQVSGSTVALSTDARLVNERGADAVSATDHWVVYLPDPDGHDYGNLDSGRTALWGASVDSLAPNAISGNRYVFRLQPTLTFTSLDVTKTFGEDATDSLAYSVRGYQPGVPGAFRGDTAATAFSGRPQLTSAGASSDAPVEGSPYPIQIAQGQLVNTAGYRFVFKSTGRLTVRPAADLSILKAGPATAFRDRQFEYTLAVTNAGPHDAGRVTVGDTLADGIEYASASGDGTCSVSSRRVTCDLGTVADGATETVTLRVNATASGQVENRADVSSEEAGDPQESNNLSDPVGTQINAVADLSVSKSGPATAARGEQFDYTLEVTNAGPSDARRVVLDDTLPEDVEYVWASGEGTCSESSGRVTCDLGTVADGDTKTVTIRVRATQSGEVENRADVSSDDPQDPDELNNASDPVTTEIKPVANLSISKSGPATAVRGELFDYSLEVRNAGPDNAPSVVLGDTLPDGVEYVSASGDGTCSESSGRVVCDLGTVVKGATETFTVRVRAASSGGVTNRADVSDEDVSDPEGSNNSDAATTTVLAPPDPPGAQRADLSLHASAPGSVGVGRHVAYTFRVLNAGPNSARGSTLRVMLSEGQRFVAASRGCVYARGSRRLTCNLGRITRGGEKARGVTVQATAPSSIHARGVVSSETDDPRPQNNADTETVAVRRSAPGGSRCTVLGTRGNDVVVGTRGADVICAGTGNDVVRGAGGDDTVLGGDGNDVVSGGEGDDTIFGGAGNDLLSGGLGADRLFGGAGNDVVNARDGRRGNDRANGGRGNDACMVDVGDGRESCG